MTDSFALCPNSSCCHSRLFFVNLGSVPVASKDDKANIRKVTACLEGGDVLLQCKEHEKIKVVGVGFAHEPFDCKAPTKNNKCIQTRWVLLL